MARRRGELQRTSASHHVTSELTIILLFSSTGFEAVKGLCADITCASNEYLDGNGASQRAPISVELLSTDSKLARLFP